MTGKQLIQLIALAAIWGGSFIFMRVLAPIFGPIWTASMRLTIAGVFLLLMYTVSGYRLNWKRDWKQLVIIGIMNSSFPFFFYAFAALYIPASLSVILNAMAPMFGAIFAAVFALEKLTVRKGIGLLLGLTGVIIISFSSMEIADDKAILAILACIGATVCYGASGVYVKMKASHIPAKDIACGSQLFAGIALLSLVGWFPVRQTFGAYELTLLVIFAVLCSALAYLIYYSLMASVGPTKTLTVTYLMPIFGVLWGVLLLGEVVSARIFLGGAVILVGTMLITNLRIARMAKTM